MPSASRSLTIRRRRNCYAEGLAVSAWLRLTADSLLAVLLAPACAACHQPLDSPTRGAVCPDCWSAIVPITPPCCRTCGDALPSWRSLDLTGLRCARCRRHPPPIVRAAAIGPYEGSLRAILHVIEQMTDEERRQYLSESLFLNTVSYENERLGAYMKKLTQK